MATCYRDVLVHAATFQKDVYTDTRKPLGRLLAMYLCLKIEGRQSGVILKYHSKMVYLAKRFGVSQSSLRQYVAALKRERWVWEDVDGGLRIKSTGIIRHAIFGVWKNVGQRFYTPEQDFELMLSWVLTMPTFNNFLQQTDAINKKKEKSSIPVFRNDSVHKREYLASIDPSCSLSCRGGGRVHMMSPSSFSRRCRKAHNLGILTSVIDVRLEFTASVFEWEFIKSDYNRHGKRNYYTLPSKVKEGYLDVWRQYPNKITFNQAMFVPVREKVKPRGVVVIEKEPTWLSVEDLLSKELSKWFIGNSTMGATHQALY